MCHVLDLNFSHSSANPIDSHESQNSQSTAIFSCRIDHVLVDSHDSLIFHIMAGSMHTVCTVDLDYDKIGCSKDISGTCFSLL